MPVKTMRRSRGSSTSTFFRLCSRAPRMVMVCPIPNSAIKVSVPGRPSERTDVRGRSVWLCLPSASREPELAEATRDDGSADRLELSTQFGDLVAQPRRLLEPELLRGFVHLLLERLDQATELLGRHPRQLEHGRA